MSTSSHETAKRVLDAVDQSGAHYGSGFPMIASENVISPMVRTVALATAICTVGTRKACRGSGTIRGRACDDFDTIETIGIDRRWLAKKVFNANFANIQPISLAGSTVANIAALKAMVKPGDRMPDEPQPLSLKAVSTADGASWRAGIDPSRHISHAQMGAVGLRGLDLHTYPWNEDRMEPDIDAAASP